MRIALDALGGDHGPSPNVAGALLAIQAIPDVTIVLVGDKTQIELLLTASGSASSERLEIIHAPQAVDMKEKPAEALRRKPDASIFQCWHLLAEGKVDGL